jgi:hypothetical protein
MFLSVGRNQFLPSQLSSSRAVSLIAGVQSSVSGVRARACGCLIPVSSGMAVCSDIYLVPRANFKSSSALSVELKASFFHSASCSSSLNL